MHGYLVDSPQNRDPPMRNQEPDPPQTPLTISDGDLRRSSCPVRLTASRHQFRHFWGWVSRKSDVPFAVVMKDMKVMAALKSRYKKAFPALYSPPGMRTYSCIEGHFRRLNSIAFAISTKPSMSVWRRRNSRYPTDLLKSCFRGHRFMDVLLKKEIVCFRKHYWCP